MASTAEVIVEGGISVQGRTCARSLPAQHGGLPDDVDCAKDLSTADCENAGLSSRASETPLPAASEVNSGGGRRDQHQAHQTSLGLNKHGSIVRALPTEAYGLQLYHISTTNAAGAATLRLARNARRSAERASSRRENVASRASSLETPRNEQQCMGRKSASMESLHPGPVSSKAAPAPAHHPKNSNHAGQQHDTDRKRLSGRSRRPLSERRRADELLLW